MSIVMVVIIAGGAFLAGVIVGVVIMALMQAAGRVENRDGEMQ